MQRNVFNIINFGYFVEFFAWKYKDKHISDLSP